MQVLPELLFYRWLVGILLTGGTISVIALLVAARFHAVGARPRYRRTGVAE